MRTNIVLDEQLIIEALKLSGKKNKKEVVNFALKSLVRNLKQQSLACNSFINNYVDSPIILDDFTPLKRDDIYER